MNTLQKRLILILIAGLFFLGACSDSSPRVPSNIEDIQAEGIGAILEELDYTPVVRLTSDSLTDWSTVGYIFVACGDEPVYYTACSTDRRHLATAERPNLWVVDDKIIKLEGPTFEGRSNYCMNVPEEFQDFANLSTSEREALLRIMPELIDAFDVDDGYSQTLDLSIGPVDAETC